MILNEKNKDEKNELESYYRDAFWKPILYYNRLRIYYPLYCANPKTKEEDRKYYSEKWEEKAVASWSQYLSKKMLIGEYHIEPLYFSEMDTENAIRTNFICVGEVNPFSNSKKTESRLTCISSQDLQYLERYKELLSDENKERYPELSQLILWREFSNNTDPENDGTVNYRVSINGCTGSARLSLSSLLVDDDLENTLPEKENLLCDLQAKIREKLYTKYINELKIRLEEIETKISNGKVFVFIIQLLIFLMIQKRKLI